MNSKHVLAWSALALTSCHNVLAAPISGTGGSTSNSALQNGTTVNFNAQSIGSYSSFTQNGVTFSGSSGLQIRVQNTYQNQYNMPSGNYIDNNAGNTSGFRFSFQNKASAFGFNFGAVNIPFTLKAFDSSGNLLETLNIPVTVPIENNGRYYGFSRTSADIDSATLESAGGDWVLLGLFAYDLTPLASTVTLPTPNTQPYADIQSVSIDALKNQRELVLAQAGECDQNGWVIYDSEKVKGKTKPKKYQSLCVFGEGGYAQGDINGSSDIGGYSTSNATTAYGVEWKPSKKWAVGAAYGYGTANLGNFNFDNTSAYINSDINSGNIYGVYRPNKNWKISALAGYSKFNSNGARTYLGDTANSTFSSNGYTGALEASYDIFLGTDLNNKKNKSNPVRFKPLVGIAWGGNQQSAFSETGNGTLLNLKEQMSNSLVATFGASLEAPIPLNKKKTTVLKPRFGIAYQYDFLANQDGNKQITATLQSSPTTSYSEVGQNRGINNIYLNLGGDLQVNPRTALYANVNYQAFSYGNQIGYQGGIRIKL